VHPSRLPFLATFMTLVGLCALTLAGCAPPSATVRLAGTKIMNQNELGESAPVDLRLYPLKNDGKFRSATVDALWVGDKDLLGSDLTHEATIATVFPDGDREPAKVVVQLGEGAKWLGVLALYAKSDATDRRVLVLPVDDAESVIITCIGYSVTIEPQKSKK
jgi:type VI secretion system VasD/TssJ family lipoprotein